LHQGYVDSIGFVSARIADDVEKILADSETPPVIVIFSDHGLEGDNRLQNFAAIYLPGNSGDLLRHDHSGKLFSRNFQSSFQRRL
jgi:hypothetical protein